MLDVLRKVFHRINSSVYISGGEKNSSTQFEETRWVFSNSRQMFLRALKKLFEISKLGLLLSKNYKLL